MRLSATLGRPRPSVGRGGVYTVGSLAGLGADAVKWVTKCGRARPSLGRGSTGVDAGPGRPVRASRADWPAGLYLSRPRAAPIEGCKPYFRDDWYLRVVDEWDFNIFYLLLIFLTMPPATQSVLH